MNGSRTAYYTAPRWLPGGHLQTMYSALVPPRPPVAYQRTRWDTPDGDFIDVDAIAPRPGAPTVVLFHGLEGSSRSHYARALMATVEAVGWNGMVAHFRGCGGELNRLPRAYHSGDSAEIDWILRRVRANSGTAPLFAVGVSLGGNALLKWLGEQGPAAQGVLHSAVSICAPVDLAASGHALGAGFSRLYTRMFLLTLKRKALAKLAAHPGIFDAGALRRARNLYQFDNVVTAPLHGFRDTDDYWARASSRPWLKSVAVPTLLLHALNDPFVPAWSLPGAPELSRAITVERPATGGHVGFTDGGFPGRLDWLPARAIGFLAEMGGLVPQGADSDAGPLASGAFA